MTDGEGPHFSLSRSRGRVLLVFEGLAHDGLRRHVGIGPAPLPASDSPGQRLHDVAAPLGHQAAVLVTT